MTRILFLTLAILLSAGAQAAVPEFNTDHFCADFAQKRAGNMPEMAKAICLMSEQSTKTVVDKAWDHAAAASKESCLKTAGESYVILAHCLSSVPGQ
jgi:hypothetical protein